MFLHYKYLDEHSPIKGHVAWYVVKVENPEKALAVVRAIDAEFSGALLRTLTETEQAFQTRFREMSGQYQAYSHDYRRGRVFYPAAGDRQHHGHGDQGAHR